MNKRHVFTVASISGIFGMMMGVLMASWVWLSSNADFARAGAIARAETAITKKVELLAQLRTGHYADAVHQLEAWLDSDVEHASELARDGVAVSLQTLNAVDAERKARNTPAYQPARTNLGDGPDTYFPGHASAMGARTTPAVSRDDAR